jgi:alpha-ketoglutarate-dependent taurine dioxygenase
MAAPATLSIPHATYPLATHPDALPLVVEARGDRTATALAAWCKMNAGWVADALARHGALLFRDLDVADAPAFEQVARAVDDDLKCDYLGTSPRDALTGYVFTASELPSYYPIPQHCEMSFVADPPRHLFFCCLVEPTRGCGATPLADFTKVAAELPASVMARFEARGLRIVRNYSGPGGGRRFDLWRLKRWDQMFGTTDRREVEARCRREGFDPVWTKGDGLRIVSWQPAIRTHPVTGERVWHNHSTTFHPTQAAPAALPPAATTAPASGSWRRSSRRYAPKRPDGSRCTARTATADDRSGRPKIVRDAVKPPPACLAARDASRSTTTPSRPAGCRAGPR